MIVKGHDLFVKLGIIGYDCANCGGQFSLAKVSAGTLAACTGPSPAPVASTTAHKWVLSMANYTAVCSDCGLSYPASAVPTFGCNGPPPTVMPSQNAAYPLGTTSTAPITPLQVTIGGNTLGGITPGSKGFWKPAETTATAPPKPDPKKCPTCDIQLSSTLDAYYGRNAFYAGLCVKCRDAQIKASDKLRKKLEALSGY